MDFIWKVLILITVGLVFLRIAGRKSISQMTIAQTVVMISIGSLIIQPFTERSVVKTIVSAGIFIAFIMLIEYLQIKFDFMENLLSGKAKILISDGKLVSKNLKKLRITADQVEMRLRQKGISKISDVKTATLEPNGQLGYELMRHAKPVTIGELEKMLGSLLIPQSNQPETDYNIFTEVKEGTHYQAPPQNLQ